MLEIEQNERFKDETTLARLMSVNNNLDNAFSTFYEEVDRNIKYVEGQIYDDADLKKLNKENRPVFQTNLFRPLLNQMGGSFISNMPDVDLIGVTPDDHAKANLFKAVNQHIFHQANNLSYELSKAYLHAQISRISWLRQEFSFQNDPRGMVEIEHYNSKLKFDTATARRDMRDCQYMIDSAYYTPDELVYIFAYNNSELEAELKQQIHLYNSAGDEKDTWLRRLVDMAMSFFDSSLLVESDFVKDGRFLTLDFYERRMERQMMIYDRLTGQSFDITNEVKRPEKEVPRAGYKWYDDAKLEQIKKQIFNPFIEESFIEKIYQTSVVPALNMKLWDEPQQLQNGNFKFVPVLGYNYSPKIIDSKSLIDDIKDQVKSYNLRDNTNLTYLLRSAHGGYLVEKSVREQGLGDLEKNPIAGITYVPDGTIGQNKIREKGVPRLDASVINYQDQKFEEIKYVSGSSDNARGMQESSHESGKLFQARVAQSNTMQEWVNNNAQSTLKELTKNNIYYITNFITEQRIIRIIENGEPEYMEVNVRTLQGIKNDLSAGQFDIQISAKPFGREAKEVERQRLLELIELLMNFGDRFDIAIEKLVIEVIKTTPIAAQADIIKALKGDDPETMQRIQEQAAMQQQAAQLEMADKTAKVEEKIAKTKKILAEVDKTNRDDDYEDAEKSLSDLLKNLVTNNMN